MQDLRCLGGVEGPVAREPKHLRTDEDVGALPCTHLRPGHRRRPTQPQLRYALQSLHVYTHPETGAGPERAKKNYNQAAKDLDRLERGAPLHRTSICHIFLRVQTGKWKGEGVSTLGVFRILGSILPGSQMKKQIGPAVCHLFGGLGGSMPCQPLLPKPGVLKLLLLGCGDHVPCSPAYPPLRVV